jgi:hypothetical protein
MAKTKLSKEQRAAVSAANRSARMRRAKENFGETIAQKVGLAAGGYTAGLLPELGPVNTTTVGMVLGYGLAIAVGGKIGSVGEGLGDSGLAVMLARKGTMKRREAAEDSFLRDPMFGPIAGTRTAAATRPQNSARAFAAGRAAGLRDGARVGIQAALEGMDDDEDEAMAEVQIAGALEAQDAQEEWEGR